MATARRRIVLQVAASLDGFIADPDGGVGWLPPVSAPDAYGMDRFMARIDAIVWGRRTYEQALGLGGLSMFGKGVRHYVLSRKPGRPGAAQDVEFVQGPVEALASRLRAEGRPAAKDVWLMGGADAIGAFLDAGEVDEVILHVVPILLGAGIPLAPPRLRSVRLVLLEATPFDDGVVRLRYDVQGSASPKKRSNSF